MKENPHVFIISGKNPLKNAGGYASYAFNLTKILAQKRRKGHLHVVCISENNKNCVLETDFCYVHNVKILFKFIKTPLLPLHAFTISNHIKKYIHKQNFNGKIFIVGIGPWGLVGTWLKNKIKNPIELISIYFTTFKHEGKGLLDGVVVSDYGIAKKIKYLAIYLTVIRVLSYFEKKLCVTSDYILVHYNSSSNILKNEFCISNKFIYTPYYSVETFKKEIETQDVPQNIFKEPMILTICRQESRKGINYLLHAIQKIIYDYRKIIYCIIIGSGDLLSNNIKLSKKLKIEEHVKFLGFINNVEPYLQSANIFVLPSIEEGASAIALQEAMRYGLPIITTNCDGMPEDISDGVSGLLVPPRNPHALAEAIIKILEDKKLAQKLGENAKEVYNNKFSEENVMNLVQIFSDIFDQREDRG